MILDQDWLPDIRGWDLQRDTIFDMRAYIAEHGYFKTTIVPIQNRGQ